jgi:hypothetical protein
MKSLILSGSGILTVFSEVRDVEIDGPVSWADTVCPATIITVHKKINAVTCLTHILHLGLYM